MEVKNTVKLMKQVIPTPTSGFDFGVDVDSEKGDLIGKTADLAVWNFQRHGAAGYGTYAAERRIPKPYPASKFVWSREEDISRLPSVGASDIVTGPEKTVYPSEISIYHDVCNRSVGERTQKVEAPVPIRLVPQEPQLGLPLIQEFLMGPTRKWRQNGLKNTPLMPQLAKSLPLVRILRGR
jgi:hypothetical protein